MKAGMVSTMVLMIVGAPAVAQAQGQTFNFPDGSGSINVPSGWIFQGEQAGETHVSGPRGELIVLGGQYGFVQNALPGTPNWIGRSSYIADPVQAFFQVMRPQFPDVRVLSVRRVSNTAAYMHYQLSGQGIQYRGFGYMQTFNVDGNAWYLSASTAAAKASDFASSFPTMLSIWASHRFNGSQPWANVGSVARGMQSGGSGPTESQRSEERRLTTMGQDLIEDTKLHTRHQVDVSKADDLVRQLNQREGWERYRVVPNTEY